MAELDATAVLHAAGDRTIGVGHLARTAALAQALCADPAWKRVTLVWECDAALAKRFRPPEADCALASDRPAALALLGEFAQRGRPALLVSDVFAPPPHYFIAARRLGFAAVAHLNDSGATRREADLLVDSDGYKGDADAPAGYIGEALMGAPYQILREQIVRQRPAQPRSGGPAARALVALGGADPAALTARFVQECLVRLGGTPTLTVVVGPGFSSEHRRALHALHGAGAPLALKESLSDLAGEIRQTELVVGLGGATAYEAMCLGRPCAALAWEHLTPYVEGLAAAGLLANLGPASDLAAAAEAFVCLARDGARLTALARAGWERIDGRGAKRVADRLAGLIGRALAVH